LLISLLDVRAGDIDLEDGEGHGLPTDDRGRLLVDASDLRHDDDEPDDDAKGDVSWTEWHTRGRYKLDSRSSESRHPMSGTTPHCQVGEDDEDDDPAEADGDEQDGVFAEDDFAQHAANGPGCSVSDPGGLYVDEADCRPIADPIASAHHRDRIRLDRCTPVYRRDFWRGGSVRDGWRLIDGLATPWEDARPEATS
jgi:hypothetical protein